MSDDARKTMRFEEAMAELEQLVASMESGKLTLDDALAAYQRGTELVAFCRARLEEAQQRVRVLEEGTLQDFPAADLNG